MFDLDQAIREDAAGEPFRFTFHGEEYQVSAGADVERAAIVAGTDPEQALHLLIGAVQRERLMARPDAALVFRSLHRAYLEHQG